MSVWWGRRGAESSREDASTTLTNAAVVARPVEARGRALGDTSFEKPTSPGGQAPVNTSTHTRTHSTEMSPAMPEERPLFPREPLLPPEERPLVPSVPLAMLNEQPQVPLLPQEERPDVQQVSPVPLERFEGEQTPRRPSSPDLIWGMSADDWLREHCAVDAECRRERRRAVRRSRVSLGDL